MFKFLSSMFSNDISIDLGTANTLICMKEKGIVLNEPSVVAVKTENQQKIVVAVGHNEKKMLGKTPKNIETIRPMKDGVIADDKYIIEMLRRFLKKVQGNGFLKSAPRVLISVPGAATPAQRKTIYGAAEKIGASEIFMIDEPMAAAIGAKLPVEQSVGSMVVDIGGGTTDIAIISINDMLIPLTWPEIISTLRSWITLERIRKSLSVNRPLKESNMRSVPPSRWRR